MQAVGEHVGDDDRGAAADVYQGGGIIAIGDCLEGSIGISERSLLADMADYSSVLLREESFKLQDQNCFC